jgi:UDP-N-acetylglucosamine:LPS N-acetylglucosamine transferase
MSITAGEGHNSTARAVKEFLDANGVECKILDTYGYVSGALKKVVSEGYLFASEKAKTAYSKSYRLAEKRSSDANELSAMRLANLTITHKIHGYIEEYDPDVIVFTHPFAGIVVDLLKQKNRVNMKTIGIVTDFTIHPYWEECLHTDYIVVASELLEYQAVMKGFRHEQIVTTGIPIHPKFASAKPKTEIRRSLNLKQNLPTLLLMGGSMGYGNMVSSVEKLDKLTEDFQMITVCGNNAKAKSALSELPLRHKTVITGFVTNIDELMDASDCIISKPGGLTTSEALAKQLPMIIINPIPGQEERNAEFLLNCGTAMSVSASSSIEEITKILLNNPQRMQSMKQNTDLIRKPNSTNDIGELILKERRDA